MPSFSVQNFLSQALPEGGARPSLFRVDMFFPFQTSFGDRAQFLARAASIPPAPLNTIRVPYQGRAVKIAGDREFPDWTVTIMNDEDFPLRVALEKWSNGINYLVSNVMDASLWPLGYKGRAMVTQMGKQGNDLRRYIFNGIFPTNVDAMQLDWDAQNQLQQFDVTFAYDTWEPDTSIETNADDFSGTNSDLDGVQTA